MPGRFIPSRSSAATPPPAPPITYDRFMGIPHLRWMAEELDAGRWEATHDSLSQLTNPDDRAFAVRIITNQGGFPLDDWRRARRDSALAWYAIGEYKLNSAWLVRGPGHPAQVPPARWQRFRTLLGEGESALQHAATLDPADPLPWAAMIRSGLGLDLGTPVLRERYLAAEQARPGSVHAQLDLVTALAQQGPAAHEEMFTFARWVHQNLPAGSAGHAALLVAHVERWVHLCSLDTPTQDVSTAYYRDPGVVAELNRVMAQSLWHPAYVESMHSVVERNYAVFGYAIAGLAHEANALFAVIGDRFTPTPASLLPGGPGATRSRSFAAAAALPPTS